MLAKIDLKMVKREIIIFIREFHHKTGENGIIIGLSGGIDSTLVAYLLKEAIGNENIYSYHFVSSTTPKEDTIHARLVAKLLDIEYKEIAIDSIYDEFLNLVNSSENEITKDFKNNSNNKISGVFENKSINELNTNNKNKSSEGNFKARIRMSLLYYFANLKNSIVAGTTNKSELLIGYFTKYGDGASDFEPIADIYKTQLKKLAILLNIPKEIINKPPRAGLWENQTDEEEIGFTYETLDQLLYLINDKKLNNEEILNKMDISKSEIDIVREKIISNEHKLHFPPRPFEDKKLF